MADTSKMTSLEQAFHKSCLEGIEMLSKKHGYTPTYFLRMVHQYGGAQAVRQLLTSPNFQGGLTSLWEIDRLDASIEAAILNPRWSPLFTEEEKKEAKKRLAALNYTPQS